jgi:hypothetical protein
VQESPAEGGLSKTSAGKGVVHIADLKAWVQQPRRREGTYACTLARLSVEADQVGLEWAGYRGGCVERKASSEAAAGGEPLPLDPARTAQAASLLVRVVRTLPQERPGSEDLGMGAVRLRGLLEPLVEELMEAVYRDWKAPSSSLSDMPEADVSTQRLFGLAAYYSLVGGHRAQAKDAIARAEAAEKEATELRLRATPREHELVVEREARKVAEETGESLAQQLEEAQQNVVELKETLSDFRKQTRLALADYAELQHKTATAEADCRNMLREQKDNANRIKELQDQSNKLTQENQRLEGELKRTKFRLEDKEAETKQLPEMRELLDRYERQEISNGVRFAEQLAREVFKASLEEVCSGHGLEQRNSSEKLDIADGLASTTAYVTHAKMGGGLNARKAQLNMISARLQAMPVEIKELRELVRRLKLEVSDLRQLIPIWNQDAAEDLEDAYNQDAPIHRQVFSMKDTRSFVGLGKGDHVPDYLRAEGFVRHIFVSKGELEEFMRSFMGHLFSEDRVGDVDSISTALMHAELYKHLQRQDFKGEHLTEFAYAFLCGLEAYRDDPDFELFDLMLSGAVHPSITQDSNDMLRELQNLIRSCEESQLDDSLATSTPKRVRDRASSVTSLGSPSRGERAQVSRRMIRAVLHATFPDKKPERHNALARALDMTLHSLSASAKTTGPDHAYVSDIFQSTSDGTQSQLIEEVRRQHYYEIVEFTAKITKRVREGDGGPDGAGREELIDASSLRKALNRLDTRAKPQPTYWERWVKIGCPDPNQEEPVGEVLARLRHRTLLRPPWLWVRAKTQDVRDKLVSVGPSPEEQELQPQRNRTAIAIDNPSVKMKSEALNTPEGLMKTTLQKSIRGTAIPEGEEDYD